MPELDRSKSQWQALSVLISAIDDALFESNAPTDRGVCLIAGRSPILVGRGTPVSSQNENPRVSIPPEEDARLPILEAEIEREWRKWRPKYVRDLVKDGRLQSQIRETGLWCIETMNRGQERGMNPDQCREMIRPLIHPQFDNS